MESRGKHLLLNGSGQRWEKIGVGVCKRWKFCDHLIDVVVVVRVLLLMYGQVVVITMRLGRYSSSSVLVMKLC